MHHSIPVQAYRSKWGEFISVELADVVRPSLHVYDRRLFQWIQHRHGKVLGKHHGVDGCGHEHHAGVAGVGAQQFANHQQGKVCVLVALVDLQASRQQWKGRTVWWSLFTQNQINETVKYWKTRDHRKRVLLPERVLCYKKKVSCITINIEVMGQTRFCCKVMLWPWPSR